MGWCELGCPLILSGLFLLWLVNGRTFGAARPLVQRPACLELGLPPPINPHMQAGEGEAICPLCPLPWDAKLPCCKATR